MGTLPDGTMGSLALDVPRTAQLYGDLAVRFNGLRQFYRCVRDQLMTHTAEKCL